MFVFHFLRLNLLWLVLIILSGCSSPDLSAPSAESAVPESERRAVELLESAGALVRKNDTGHAIDVNLSKQEISSETISALRDLKSLTAVNFAESSLNDDSLTELGVLSGQITNLDVRGCQLSDAAADVIGKFTSLRALRFSGKNGRTTLADDGLRKLAGCSSLKVLALDDLWIGTDGLEVLTSLKNLEELYLAGTLTDDDTCKLIAACSGLRKLRLARTQVSDAALETLTACSQLEDLDLSENSLISDAGMTHLGAMKKLKKLNLWRVQVSDEGAIRLAGLTKMEWLNLDNSQLGDNGLELLKEMTSLTFLHIGSTQVTAAGAPALFHLSTLKDLKITRTALGADADAVAALRAHLPDTAIQTEYIESE